MSDAVEKTEKKEGPAAKDVSLKSMIISAVWIGALSLLKAFWGLISKATFGLSMNEIVLSGVIMAAVFSPVYLAIVLDKIRDIKVG
jgi:DMSO/TMAO reductase YedYZ heme-binding membrane subunit